MKQDKNETNKIPMSTKNNHIQKAESLTINSVGQRPTTNRNVHKTEPCKGVINNNH